MSLPLIPFYFVRHGETEANVAFQVAGHLDSPLTKRGQQQAKQVAKVVEALDNKPRKIFHSDLSRARDTAHAINEILSVDIFEHEGLREHHFGIFEGHDVWDDVFQILRRDERPEGGESRNDFKQRLIKVFNEIIVEQESPILITAHGGFAHQIQRLFGQDGHFMIDNCHLHYFEPWEENEHAPWKVYVFDIDNDGEIKKRAADWCPSIVGMRE